jgi:hypothetical protein
LGGTRALQGGTLDGRVDVDARKQGPLRIAGRLQGRERQTRNHRRQHRHRSSRRHVRLRLPHFRCAASVAAHARRHAARRRIPRRHRVRRIASTPVALSITGEKAPDAGWTLPRFSWRDGNVLTATGSAAFDADANLRVLDVRASSQDLAPVRDRYLSGPLGTAGMSDLALLGAVDAHVRIADGVLQVFDVQPHAVDIVDPATKRFAFRGIDGDLKFSRTTPVTSTLQWESGALYGLAFDAARLPMRSETARSRSPRPSTSPCSAARSASTT